MFIQHCLSLKTHTYILGTQAAERILVKQAGKKSLFWQKFWQFCGWTTNAVLRPSPTVQHHHTRRSGTPQPIIILACSSYIPWIFSNLPLLCKLFRFGKFIGFLPQLQALSSAITSCCSRPIANLIVCRAFCAIPFLCCSHCIPHFGNCVYQYT